MTTYKRGQVVSVSFPFSDLSSVKRRPALVVSSDGLNIVRQDVVLVAITSQISAQLAEDEFMVPAGELAQWGLVKPSMLKLTKLFAIYPGLIHKQLGQAPAATLEVILRRLQKQFEP